MNDLPTRNVTSRNVSGSRPRQSKGFESPYRAMLGLLAFALFLNLEGPDPIDALLVTMIFLAIPILRASTRRVRISRPVSILVMMFVVSYLLSMAAGGANVSFAANLMLNVMLLVVLVAGVRTAGAASRWMFLMSLGYSVCGLIAGLQHLAGLPTLASQFEVVRSGRFMGLYGDPNILGAFSVLIIIYWLDVLVSARRSAFKTTLVALAFLLSAAVQLLTSQSRSAWLGLAVGLFIYGVLSIRTLGLQALKRLTLAFVVTVAAASALSATTELGEQLVERLSTVAEPSSSAEEERFGFLYTLAALSVAMDHPLGVGPGMTSSATGFEPVDGNLIGAHNAFVQLFSDNGWVAGCTFVFAMFSMLKAALRAAWQGTSSLGISTAVVASGLAALVFCGLFQDLIQWRLMWVLPSIFVAMWIHDRPQFRASVSRRFNPARAAIRR